MERGRAFQTTGAHCTNALWPSFLDGLHGTDSKALLPDRKLRGFSVSNKKFTKISDGRETMSKVASKDIRLLNSSIQLNSILNRLIIFDLGSKKIFNLSVQHFDFIALPLLADKNKEKFSKVFFFQLSGILS